MRRLWRDYSLQLVQGAFLLERRLPAQPALDNNGSTPYVE